MKKYQVICIECGEKNTFADAKDIAAAKWIILGWNVKTAEPKCLCDKCEYGKPKGKKDK